MVMQIPWKLFGYDIWKGGPNELIILAGTEENNTVKANALPYTIIVNLQDKSWEFGPCLHTPRAYGCPWPSSKGWCVLGGNNLEFEMNFEVNGADLKIPNLASLQKIIGKYHCN